MMGDGHGDGDGDHGDDGHGDGDQAGGGNERWIDGDDHAVNEDEDDHDLASGMNYQVCHCHSIQRSGG